MSAKMVVKSCRRSLSFHNHSSKPQKPVHVRSTSLPCRSHPLISQLQVQLNELKTWGSNHSLETRTTEWLCDGLNRVKIVHEGLDDLLQLPQTRESLSTHSRWIENLLKDILCFIDVFGRFQTSVLKLKQEHLAMQVAIRKKDDSKITLCIAALKKTSKEISKLIATIQCIKHRSVSVSARPVSLSDSEAKLAEVLRNVNEVTVLVSCVLFNGMSSWFGSGKSWWMGLTVAKKVQIQGIREFQLVQSETLRKKGEEEVKMMLKRMKELDDCICEIEHRSERIFRSLINSRVSLLNVFTQ